FRRGAGGERFGPVVPPILSPLRGRGSMKKFAMVLGISLALAAGARVLSLRADDAPATPDIKKLADQVGKKSWDELAKEGEAGAQKNDDLLGIMHGFKPRSKDAKGSGGGGGGEPRATLPPRIEPKLIPMGGRAGVTDGDMAKAPALKRMAEIAAAVAAAAVHKPNKDAQQTKDDIKKWQELSREMHEGSLELIKALESRNRVQAKAAA